MVFADRVSCPLPGWNILFCSGAAVAPDEGSATPIGARVVAGRVWLDAVAAGLAPPDRRAAA